MARRRYQKGNIRKRGKRNPVWELQWWADFVKPDGSIGRKRESVILGLASGMTRRQALKAADEKLRPLNQGKILPYATVLFREFVERFYIPNAFPLLKDSTRKRYRSTLKLHLVPAFGNSRLCDIRTLDLQTFVIQKYESGLGWEVCDHLRNLMSKIFVCAKKWNYFAGENPASDVELPEKLPVREKKALNPEQIRKLSVLLREPVRTMFLVGILTGLRIGEILGLRWKDLDFEAKELRVEQAVYRGMTGSPKTKGSKRTVPLPDTVIRALEPLRTSSADKDGLVFHSRKGTALNDTNLLLRHLKPAGRQIGAPWLSWHTLRRTHATLLQHAGGSLKDAQAQLGHAQMSTTLEIYTLPIPAHQRESVEKLSQMVTNGDELHPKTREPRMLTEQIQ